MEKQEIKKMIVEEVGKSSAHHFGLIQEILTDQFAASREGMQSFQESMNRQFKEVSGQLDGVKDRLSDVEVGLSEVKDRLSGVEVRLSGVEEGMVDVKERLGKLEHEREYA